MKRKYQPVDTRPKVKRSIIVRDPAVIKEKYGEVLDKTSVILSKSYLLHTLADSYFEEAMDSLQDAGLIDNGQLRHAITTLRRGFNELVTQYNIMMTKQNHENLSTDYSNIIEPAEKALNDIIDNLTV